MDSITLDEVLSRLEGVQNRGNAQYKAFCPCHNDETQSLSIGIGDNGKILVNCFTGCDWRRIYDTLGIGQQNAPHSNGKLIEKVYDYRDATGTLLFQKVRFCSPKGFAQRLSPDQEKWSLSGLTDEQRDTLYRLPDLLANPDRRVVVVEGEKDADNLARIDVLATCNAGGADKSKSGNRKWSKHHAEQLRGRKVVIIPDNDESGLSHAQHVASTLQSVAKSVVTVNLPDLPEKGDVSDWLEAGGTKDELKRLIKEAAESGDQGERLPEPIPIVQFLQENRERREPIIDGLLRRGETANIISGTKQRKTWTILGLACCVAKGVRWLDMFATRPGRVLVVDNELPKSELAYRLKTVAETMFADKVSPLGEIDGRIDILSLRGHDCDIGALRVKLLDYEPGTHDLVMLDSLYKFIPADKSENDPSSMTYVYRAVEAIAMHLDAGVLANHHSTKGDQSFKGVTDVGSGSGTLSRAVDSHIVLRPHVLEDLAVLDAAVRSFRPVAPLSIKWDFPTWTAMPAIRPEVKTPDTMRKRKQASNDTTSKATVLEMFGDNGEVVTRTQIRKQTKKEEDDVMWGYERVDRIVGLLIDDELIDEIPADENDGWKTRRFVRHKPT